MATQPWKVPFTETTIDIPSFQIGGGYGGSNSQGYSPYDSLNKYRQLIAQQYGMMGEDIKKRGAEVSAQQVSNTGRGVARAGVTGPLAEAAKRQAALDVEKNISEQLGKLDIAKLGEEKQITLKEAELKEKEDQANQELLRAIFGGLGSFVSEYTPVGAIAKDLTGGLFGYKRDSADKWVKE